MLELIAVVSIIGILVSVASLNYHDWMIRHGIESQTRNIFSDLMGARMRAMANNRDHFLNISASSYTVRDDTNANGVGDAGDALLFQRKLDYPISWNGSREIHFNAKGLSSANKTITIPSTVKAAYDCIVISRTRINIGQLSKGKCMQK